MKTLATLTTALLFTAGSAFAQSNDATIDQVGNDNEVKVEQIYQAGASSGMNEVFATQTGDNNKILGTNQRGAGNEFRTTQTGDNNIIDRYPSQGSSAGNSYDGYISITQSGDDNKVWDADQAGSNNSLTITQSGGDIANVEAQVSPEGGSGNTIIIDQYTGENAVGEFSPNGSGAYQEGEANTMTITQSGGAKAGIISVMVSGATESFFRGTVEGGQGLIQFGDDNTMMIDQDGASTVKSIVQDGDMNHADVTQIGDFHTTSVSQVGDSNVSNITQN